jgi:excisionase family DNA binding protein
MTDSNVVRATVPQAIADTNSHATPAPSSHKVALPDEAALLARMFLTVQETAFLLRVSARSVWRLLADPRSGFPRPRRVRGRTVLERDEVLEFMRDRAARS